MSRPTRADTPSAPLAVRVSQAERERIERAARVNRQSLSQFQRQTILAKADSVLLSMPFRDALSLVCNADEASKADRINARHRTMLAAAAAVHAARARRAIERQAYRESRKEAIRRGRQLASSRSNAIRLSRLYLAFKEVVDRDIVFSRSEGRCGICGLELLRSDFTVDHVVPLARGGEHSYANTQASHKKCNSRKGARWIGGFKTRTPVSFAI